MLNCSKCGYPLIFEFETDASICLLCTGKAKPPKQIQRQLVAWKFMTDTQLDETILLLNIFAPCFLDEAITESRSRLEIISYWEEPWPHTIKEINSPPPPISTAPTWISRLFSKQHKLFISGGGEE